MNCVNCGNPLADNDKFCTKCGQRVEAAETAPTVSEEIVTPAPEAVPVSEPEAASVSEPEAAPVSEPIMSAPTPAPSPAPAFASEPQKPAKKGFSAKAGILIAVTAVLVVVLALVFANFKVVANSMKQLVMSPEKYYASIEKQGIKELAADYTKLYDESMSMYSDLSKIKVDYAMDLELGELAYEAMGSYLGLEDATGLSKIGLDFMISIDDMVFAADVAARLGKDVLISANGMIDMEQGLAYAQVPDLSEKYLSVDFSEEMDSAEFAEIWEESSSLMEMYPSGAELEEMMNCYMGIVVDNIVNVTKDKETVVVGEIEQKSTVLEVNISEADLYNILEAICETAKSDDVVLDFVAYFAAYAEGTDEAAVKAELVQSLEETLESISIEKASASEETVATMRVYVDNKGNIIGREFNLADMEDFCFSYKMPQKGNDFGYELALEAEDFAVEVEGLGTNAGAKVNGEFDVLVGTADMSMIEVLNLTIEDMDISKWAEGKSSATFRIKPSVSLYSELGLGAAGALFAGYELVYELDQKSLEESACSFALMNGDELLGKLSLAAQMGKPESVGEPKDSIAIVTDADLVTWMATINFDKLRENLSKSSMPEELVTLIESYLSQFEMMLSY